MKVLALDIATKTGWCTETTSGTWDFKVKRGESEGMRVVRFKSRVKEMIELEGITVVSYERVAGFHKAAIIVAAEMVGVLKLLCTEMNVEIANYAATEIKKFATGKGNAKKDQMIAAAEELGFTPGDDNEADAIHLYRLTMSDIS
jgi:Holliday junction resolvasome RuvABC endonuclease subunit